MAKVKEGVEEGVFTSKLLFGKPTNQIGTTSSELLLKSNGRIKIQWGNKYIDLIKDGKLNVEAQDIIYIKSSEDDIKKNGLYLIDDKIWVNIDGVKLNLSSITSDSTVSFVEKQEKTQEEKIQALKNIGFIYDTLEEAREAEITQGIVYIENDASLYNIQNGELTKYNNVSNTATSETNNVDNTIEVDGIKYIVCENNTVSIQQDIEIKSSCVLSSENSTDVSGYKLYINNGKSTLEIDNVNERDKSGMITLFDNKHDIPDGWNICDGTNNTCDLSSHFIDLNEMIEDTEIPHKIIYIIKI